MSIFFEDILRCFLLREDDMWGRTSHRQSIWRGRSKQVRTQKHGLGDTFSLTAAETMALARPAGRSQVLSERGVEYIISLTGGSSADRRRRPRQMWNSVGSCCFKSHPPPVDLTPPPPEMADCPFEMPDKEHAVLCNKETWPRIL